MLLSQRNSAESFFDKAKKTVGVNYGGTLALTQALFPLLRKNARVVNVSSDAGRLNKIKSDALKTKFSSPTLDIPHLNKLMDEYLDAVKQNKHEELGYSENYEMSKLGVCVMTFIFQREADADPPNRNISVNCVHPGLVQTNLNGNGNMSPDEGAASSLYVALGNHNLKGQFVWHDCTVVDWAGETALKPGK